MLFNSTTINIDEIKVIEQSNALKGSLSNHFKQLAGPPGRTGVTVRPSVRGYRSGHGNVRTPWRRLSITVVLVMPAIYEAAGH